MTDHEDDISEFCSAYSNEPNLIDTLAAEGDRQDRLGEVEWQHTVPLGLNAAANAYETYGDYSRVGECRLPMAIWEDSFDKKARILDFRENIARASYNFTKITCKEPGQYGTQLEWLLPSCESPIEAHILPWLVINDYWPVCAGIAWPDRHSRGVSDKYPIVVCPQVEVAQYRLDFGIFATFKGVKKLFAFECDGAAFHEEARDHARDMALLRKGVQTIRASGTEIYNDPAACAKRVSDAVISWSKYVGDMQ